MYAVTTELTPKKENLDSTKLSKFDDNGFGPQAVFYDDYNDVRKAIA